MSNNEITPDIDINVCFLCNEKNLDMTLEITSLEQPMSEVEAMFISEQCPIIDRDNWAISSPAAPADPLDIRSLQNLTNIAISEPSLKLEICHICDLPFCENHAVEKLASSSRDDGNLQICLGKPICSSCYDDDDYETLHLESDHLEVTLPWYSCDCLQSFVCPECYKQAKTEGKQLCQRCHGNGKRLMECTCKECRDYHAPYPCKCGRSCEECLKNYKRSEKVIDIKLDVDKDFNDFFVNTVDWTKNSGFFEELGISYSNALGQMIIQVLKYWDVSPAPFFDALDKVLGKRTLEIMNENAPINEWICHLKNGLRCNESSLESTIQFLVEIFLLYRSKELFEFHVVEEATTNLADITNTE